MREVEICCFPIFTKVPAGQNIFKKNQLFLLGDSKNKQGELKFHCFLAFTKRFSGSKYFLSWTVVTPKKDKFSRVKIFFTVLTSILLLCKIGLSECTAFLWFAFHSIIDRSRFELFSQGLNLKVESFSLCPSKDVQGTYIHWGSFWIYSLRTRFRW